MIHPPIGTGLSSPQTRAMVARIFFSKCSMSSRFGLEPKPARLLAGLSETLTPQKTYTMDAELRIEMQDAALQMGYEKAAYHRNEILKLEQAIKRTPADG